MEFQPFLDTVYNAWQVAGDDSIRKGLRDLGYAPIHWKNPVATFMEIAHNGSDSDRECLAVDVEMIRDRVKNNG